ncbi:uncharacterized protein F5Z01DRAFT_631368 [Emericellopsis atlantica]|uniref:C3H1-type domain-containing protein n=1 Tax=Emericellopsis atlantica TaxID=2614577 RepID=A0A9P8CLH0_9HYPO|nr:uncharacterized protein F5Z01DRAFT_631368 [Emericellopsis atlantica]KAG9249601.1 hypothetical protein F5Z01DRAFT_631368 [Emericellopsis atlantica]
MNRHLRTGSLNIPSGQRNPSSAQTPRFDGPRSPPNTAHVPCKFFRQGTCQAGNACPFSHDVSQASETICKYFAKGNCKFGPKCANIHVLPDGRRINYGRNGVTIGSGPGGLAGRPGKDPASPPSNVAGMAPHMPNGQTSSSALTNSLYRAEQPGYVPAYPYDDRQDPAASQGQHHNLDNGIPIIDGPYTHTGSQYGSPRDEEARFGLGMSPINANGLSVLDAPLPASFDSNGISNAARFPAAPWPSSVPSKFGLESPTLSASSTAKDGRTSDTLKMLHTSAFGELQITPTNGSPQQGNGYGDEYFGKRAMHSSRFARPKMLSASVPKTTSAVDRDWENDFALDDDSDNLPENYVPENLQDLLTPAEKARRGSIRADDANVDAIRYGSPIGTSPGRWGSSVVRKDEDETSRSRSVASAFGHVGSPLRNSTLAQEMGSLGRGSNMRPGSEPMSMLSQQLQRSRLEDPAPGGASPLLHPSTARTPGKDRHMERHVSSGSISSSVTGRFTTPIDEEDPDFVFNMDEVEEPERARARKRISGGLGMGVWGSGSYAGALAGKQSSAKDSPAAGR